MLCSIACNYWKQRLILFSRLFSFLIAVSKHGGISVILCCIYQDSHILQNVVAMFSLAISDVLCGQQSYTEQREGFTNFGKLLLVLFSWDSRAKREDSRKTCNSLLVSSDVCIPFVSFKKSNKSNKQTKCLPSNTAERKGFS